METRRPLPPGATAAVALAAGSALTLTVADGIWTRTGAAETAATGLFLLGWTLLVFAVLVCGVCAVAVVGRFRSTSPLERLLVAAGVGLVAATCWLHPLAGSGSGTG